MKSNDLEADIFLEPGAAAGAARTKEGSSHGAIKFPPARHGMLAWQIGRLSGVAIRIHVTLPLLLAWIAGLRYAERGHWPDAVDGIVFGLGLCGLIVLHELGHAWAARRCGIRTRDITLYPIGGVARLERLPRQPRQELGIALAGPLVNVVLAAALFAIIGAGPIPAGVEEELMETRLLAQLAWANVALAAFNLLPALPLDGGRALRALLALKLDHELATMIAARVGQVLAVLLGLLGLMATNPFLVLLALFVWWGAAGEGEFARIRHFLAGVAVEDVMTVDFHELDADASLDEALAMTRGRRRLDLVLVRQGRAVGLLRWATLLAALGRAGTSGRARDFAERLPHGVRPGKPVDELLERVLGAEGSVVPILRDNTVVGLLTPEGVLQSSQVLAALDRGIRP